MPTLVRPRAQVDALVHSGFHHAACKRPDIDSDRVKKAAARRESLLAQPLGQAHGLAVDTLRNRLKPFGP